MNTSPDTNSAHTDSTAANSTPAVTAADVKISAPETPGARVRFAEAAGRRFRVTRDWDDRRWYELDEIIDGGLSYSGSARLLSGVAERIAKIVSGGADTPA